MSAATGPDASDHTTGPDPGPPPPTTTPAATTARTGVDQPASPVPPKDQPDRSVLRLDVGGGGPDGFNGDGPTSPWKILHAGGLPDWAAHEVELRIHGVGGGAPEDLLEDAAWVQVGGDATAQFVRRVGGGPTSIGRPLEGYWWGGLTSRSVTRALWVTVLPFLLCNLVPWMSDGGAAETDGPARNGADGHTAPASTNRRTWRRAHTKVARLVGLLLTIAFTTGLMTAFVDVIGWQAAGRNQLPSWLSWLHQIAPGPRMVLCTLPVIAVFAIVGFLGRWSLREHEAWTIDESLAERFRHQPLHGVAMLLGQPGFWHGEEPVKVQQRAHGAAAFATAAVFLAAPTGSGWWLVVWGAGLLVIGLTTVALCSRAAGRSAGNPQDPHARTEAARQYGGGTDDQRNYNARHRQLVIVEWAAGVLLASAMVARGFSSPAEATTPTSENHAVATLPGDGVLWVIIAVTGALLLTATLVINLSVRQASSRRQAPSRDWKPFAAGLLPAVTSTIALTTGGVYALGFALLLPHLLHTSAQPTLQIPPVQVDPNKPVFAIPGALAAFSLALFAAAVVLAALALAYLSAWALAPWRLSILELIADLYPRGLRFDWSLGPFEKLHKWLESPRRGKTPRLIANLPPPPTAAVLIPQVRQTTRAIGKAKLTDRVGVLASGLALGALVGAAGYDVRWLGRERPLPGWLQWVLDHLTGWSLFLSLAAIGALFGLTVQAFSSGGQRRSIGVLWDVGTFWPRACHPFAPPCYAERAIPELVNRISAGFTPADKGADPDERERDVRAGRWDQLLVNGYSQGAPIAVAAIAQLPEDIAEGRTRLVTVGAPLRRLYGRAFPAYFGQLQLLLLRGRLVKDGWINAQRHTDYIGGFIFDNQARPEGHNPPADRPTVDRLILDPPTLLDPRTLHATPERPIIHKHSDFWPDPQVSDITDYSA